MPDVNLLRDTQQTEVSRPKTRPTAQPVLSDPELTPKRSLGESLRALLGKKSPAPMVAPTPAVRSSGMSMDRSGSGQRILTDKAQSAQPLMPLPEEDSYNVNLLTEDVVGNFNPRLRLIQLGIAAVGAAGLVVAAYFGIQVYRKSIDDNVTKTLAETAQVQSDITKMGPSLKTAESVNTRLAAIRTIIDQHVRWTKFFGLLEKYTLPQVTYGPSFSGGIGSQMTFSATTDSYERLAQQYLVFQQAKLAGDFITDFTISGATKGGQDKVERVQFNVALNLVPSVYYTASSTKSATSK